jgi:uncharacterized membrane protein (UPF0127 family)
MMRIRNTTTGEIVATEVTRADGWRERMLGLITRKRVEAREGIWFDECALIHTVGMQTRIDIVFLDKDRRVVRTLCSVPQNRLAVGCRGARSVIELGSGTLNQCDILVGDHLELEQ